MNKNSSPYASAGWLINEHLEKRRGLKSIAFDCTKGKKGGAPDKATYATVCKTMQHLSTINEILNANNKRLRKAIDFDSVRNKGLLYVLLYELLFSKYKSIRGGGKIKRMIVKYEKDLRKEADICGVGAITESVNFPRYIRVNTLQANTLDIVDKLKTDLLSKDTTTLKSDSIQIYADAHVPDLLVLPPTASSWLHYDYESVKSGKIILQDKSSCFSALAMIHGLGGDDIPQHDYIDACAAPGNKTSHLAALINSSIGDAKHQSKKKRKGKQNNKPMSTVFAFDRDGKRHRILQERMQQLVPSTSDNGIKVAVESIHGDFLKADPSDPMFANVKAIMLDPSCSGSGIVNSPDRDDAKKDEQRIQSLSNFQLVALKHCMSFPNVDKIVYSTCSVYEEENEAVVSKVLSEMEKSEDDGDQWELIAPVCLEHWPRKGKQGGIGGLTRSQADCLIRCDGLDGDETNGFFVACFVRNRLISSMKPRKKIVVADSTPIYNGEFADMCKASSSATTPAMTNEASTDHTNQQVSAQKQPEKKNTKATGQAQKQPEKKKTTKATGQKFAKKREKKLAWKNKQALMKAERLKKKEKAA